MRASTLSTALLPLLLALPAANANCTTFTQSGGAYAYQPRDQFQPVSAALTCNGTSSTYGTCHHSVVGNASAAGCALRGSGSFPAQGTTNLSLSPAAAAFLWPLLNASADFSAVFVPGAGFAQSLDGGCVDEQTMAQCLDVGQAAYLQAWPNLLCANGTVSGCDAAGGVANGTAVSVCGVRVISATYNSHVVLTPAWGERLVNVTAEEAAELSVDPAANATCSAYFQSGAVVARGGAGLGGVVVGAVAVLCGLALF